MGLDMDACSIPVSAGTTVVPKEEVRIRRAGPDDLPALAKLIGLTDDRPLPPWSRHRLSKATIL
jgi:hypothetical protein